MFNNILVAIDFSDSSRAALLEGMNLGRRALSKIHAVHVITYLEDIFRATRYPIPDTKWRKAVRQRLYEFFPKSLYPNSKRLTIIGGSTADEILEYARFYKCELIVTGSHGRGAFKRLLLGSVTTALMRSSQIPVMMVREDGKSDVGNRSFRRILVPIDFSSASIKALSFAVQFAEFLDSEIHLLHVVEPPAIATFKHTSNLPKITIPKSCELNVDHLLFELINEYSEISEPKVRTCFGNPAEEILHYVSEQACDLIVMGTHGRSSLERTIMGSVTTSILARTRIPVITLSAFETVFNYKVVPSNVNQIGVERIRAT
jgi:nucleotide-binding universal stress UspA family protein